MTPSALRRALSAALDGAREGRAGRRVRDAAVGGITGAKESSRFWWPRTDSIEHARKAAKGASAAFGLAAVASLAYGVFCIFKGHALTADGCAAFLVTALFAYLTWRTYARPTVLLSCLAFALTALDLVFNVALLVAVNKPDAAGPFIRASFLPFLALVAALGGLRGSIALRRFAKQAPPYLSGAQPERQ